MAFGEAAVEAFFVRIADDSTARAERMLEDLAPSLTTGLRLGPQRMGRWMAWWILRYVKASRQPPGVAPERYECEHLGVHLAAAFGGLAMMADPNHHSSQARRALLRSVSRRAEVFTESSAAERAALAYVDAIESGNLAAVGLIGGERVAAGVVGEGLLIAGTGLAFVAAWSRSAWSRMAPSFTIR